MRVRIPLLDRSNTVMEAFADQFDASMPESLGWVSWLAGHNGIRDRQYLPDSLNGANI